MSTSGYSQDAAVQSFPERDMHRETFMTKYHPVWQAMNILENQKQNQKSNDNKL
jgi:hypothetical protein